jgi:succinylglutamate desuccinylase
MLSLGNLLAITLDGREPLEKSQYSPDGTRLRWLAEGALEVTPAPGRDSGLDFLISAGVHGNETAPIELVDQLLRDIASGAIKPAARLLFILGNPESMRAGVRYVLNDVNRLFFGRHATAQGSEATRAGELEKLASNFFSSNARQKLHYDLHTAIRGSKIEKFALYPWADGREHSRRELARLHGAGIGAVLLQYRTGITFSSYTYAQLGAEAFTLELGSARPFGMNADIDLQGLQALLERLVEGKDEAVPVIDEEQIQLFAVAREVIKQSDLFRLHLDGDVENFTELEQGFLLAEDADGVSWVVEEQAARIVFPNPHVKVGLRAGLLVIPVKPLG